MPGYGVMIIKMPNRRPRLTRMILGVARRVLRATRGRGGRVIVEATTWLYFNYCLEGPWSKRR